VYTCLFDRTFLHNAVFPRLIETEDNEMAKLLVVYDQPTNREGFDGHYFGTHIPLAEKLPDIKSVQANRVLGVQNSELNPYLVVQLEFENAEELNRNLASRQGQELTADVKNLLKFLPKPPAIIIVD
jgi:uncharacterized protein (TIGR02118 family)